MWGLSYLDKLSIVHNKLVEKESYDDTARKFRVKLSLVNSLMSKVKKNPDFLKDLADEVEHQRQLRENVKEVTLAML